MRLAWVLVLLAVACSTAPRPASSPAGEEEGLASWYGEPYHGRQAASGERYDMHAMTAAHRTLPFGTLAEVTNLENGKKAQVVINDRGPFVPGRILDLSRAAAAELGMLTQGVARVRLRVLRLGDGMPGNPCWEVQVGAFALAQNVEAAVALLHARGYAWRTLPAGGGLTRVRVTGLAGLPRARKVATSLQANFPQTFVVPCAPAPEVRP